MIDQYARFISRKMVTIRVVLLFMLILSSFPSFSPFLILPAFLSPLLLQSFPDMKLVCIHSFIQSIKLLFSFSDM